MSTQVPKYLIGQFGDHLAMCTAANSGDAQADAALDASNAELRHAIGNWHGWTPSETPNPGDPMFVVMRQYGIGRVPHPNWQALPHVYKRTTIAEHHANVLTGWAKAAFDAAKQTDGSYTFGQLIILPTHDVVDLALAIHAIHPVFEP